MAQALDASKHLADAIKAIEDDPTDAFYLRKYGEEVAVVVSLAWREDALDAMAVRQLLRKPAVDKLIAYFRAIDYDDDYEWPDTEAEHVYELLQAANVLDEVLAHLDGGT